MLEQGRATHFGACRRRVRPLGPQDDATSGHTAGVLRQDFSGAAAAPEIEGHLLEAGRDATDSTTATPDDEEEDVHEGEHIFTSVDKAWLQLFYHRSDVKMSLLDECLGISQIPDTCSFRSARHMMNVIDALPGPAFQEVNIAIEGSPEPYTLLFRDIIEVARTLLDRLNGELLDPRTMADHHGTSEFVHGARFQKLSAKLHDAAGPRAVLAPLVLSSGTR